VIKALGERMIRAAKLDRSLYEEIKVDRRAPVQAAMVVILAAAAAGVSAIADDGMGGFFYRTMQAMVQWYAWVFFTYLVGTRLLQEPQTKIDCGTTVRMISFASAPGVVGLLGVIPIPGFSNIVIGLVLAWMFGAMVIAVKEALRYTTTVRAVGACLLGLAMQYLFMGILESLSGPAPGA
jgi:hypothetical protein